MSLVYEDGPTTTTLVAATPAAITPGGTSGIATVLDGQIVDTYVITIEASAGNLDTITLGFAPQVGSTAFAPFTTSYAVTSGNVSSFVVQGFLGNLRVMCTSTSGADAVVSTAAYISAGSTPPFAFAVNGVVQNTMSLGAALSITSLTTSGAAAVGTTLTVTGATTLNGAVTLGDAGADAISIVGAASFVKEAAATLKVAASTTADTAGGALTIQGGAAAASNANGGALTLDGGLKQGSGTGGVVTVGGTAAESVAIGRSGKNTQVAGTLGVTGDATFTADIAAAGGFRTPFGPYVQDNVAASQSAVVVKLGATAAPQVNLVVPRAGSLVAITATFTVAPAGSNLIVSVLKNGSLLDATAILTVTPGATLGRVALFTKDTAALLFAAGDMVGVTVTTDGSWTATTSDMAVQVFVEC